MRGAQWGAGGEVGGGYGAGYVLALDSGGKVVEAGAEP